MFKSVGAITCLTVLVSCATPPSVLSEQEKVSYANTLSAELAGGQEDIVGAITLYEAMARALKYNLDHRVRMIELDLAKRDYDLSSYDLLPQLVANAGYYGRNKEAGSSSLSLLSGRQSLEPSTSTQRYGYNADLSASWNILDFGLSYIRAQQLADETLIYEERRRKSIISIMEEVHTAYWRAASAQRLSARLDELAGRVEKAYAGSRRLYTSRATSPLAALSYQRELTDILSESQRLKRELQLAKLQLSSLMNLPAGTEFVVDVPKELYVPGGIEMSQEEMIRTALLNRPEIRESAYAMRIGEKEAKKVILETLPSLGAYAGLNYDSNDFLFNDSWSSYGARASWDVMKVFSLSTRKKKADALLALEKARALSTANAVATQISVSRVQYASLQEYFSTSQQGAQVQSDILQQVERSAAANRTSEQTLVREQMNMIVSEARRDVAYAELQASLANLYSSIGLDPYGGSITGREDIETIAASLEKLWIQRYLQPARS